MKTKTAETPFLYYVKDGVCKSNSEMPPSGESFRGWLSASGVIRNQHRHETRDIEAAKASLIKFVKSLKPTQRIKEKDLLSHIRKCN